MIAITQVINEGDPDHEILGNSLHAASCKDSGTAPLLSSPVAHHAVRGLVPAEVWSHVDAALAAGSAYEARLEIGKLCFIRPWISAERDRVAAAVVGAIDQETAHVGRAHVTTFCTVTL